MANNSAPAFELPPLMASVRAALQGLTGAPSTGTLQVEKLAPAEVRKSIRPDALISFKNGKSYKTLRWHLTLRGLSPEAYREKWSLAADYPVTSAAYYAQRSELARSLGLGLQRRKSPSAAAGGEETQGDAAPAKRHGRPPKGPEAAADA